MAIATAAKQIIVDGMTAVVGGGVESISLCQNEYMGLYPARNPFFEARQSHIYMSMIETAEVVAAR
jgi:acetyl-CoA C-acetyltransferase